MIDWDAAVATLEIFGATIIGCALIGALVWGGVEMWRSGCYWGVGIEIGLCVFLMLLYVYFELKNL